MSVSYCAINKLDDPESYAHQQAITRFPSESRAIGSEGDIALPRASDFVAFVLGLEAECDKYSRTSLHSRDRPQTGNANLGFGDPVWRSFQQAAVRAGVPRFGTHSRHSYRSWLDAAGTPIAVQQKLMRHSDIRTTLNVYGDVVTDEMAQANTKVARVALSRAN